MIFWFPDQQIVEHVAVKITDFEKLLHAEMIAAGKAAATAVPSCKTVVAFAEMRGIVLKEPVKFHLIHIRFAR